MYAERIRITMAISVCLSVCLSVCDVAVSWWHLDFSYLKLFVPWTIRTIDGLFVPWTVSTMDWSYPPGLFVPSLDFSYPGLFVPWTVRTLLDYSYHHTMDYSYHHWTIRTVMQDLQKLTFPTKMCLFSVSQPPPWIFLTFSPNVWDFLVQILLSDYTFLSTLDYKFYLLSATLTYD